MLAEVVGELLGGDRPPAAGRRLLGAPGLARRARRGGSVSAGAAIAALRDVLAVELEEVGAAAPEVDQREPGARRAPRRAAAATSCGRGHDPQPLLVGRRAPPSSRPGRASATGSIAAGLALDRDLELDRAVRAARRARRAARRRRAGRPRRTRPGRTATGPGPGCATRAGPSGCARVTRRRSSASSSSTPAGSIAIVGSSRISTVGLLDQRVGDAEPLAHAARVGVGALVGRVRRGGPRGAARRSAPRPRCGRCR